ncbi:MAG: WG repeat-containing protein [Phycisphaeraceae bacterium]
MLACILLAVSLAWPGPAAADPQPPALSLESAIFDAVSLVDARVDDVLYPVNVNNWWGHMNRQGQLVVYPRFDWTDYAYGGRHRAVLDGRTGFIDGTGRWLVEPVFPYADRFADRYAVVGDGEQFGYIDKRGELFMPIRFEGALRFSEGFAAVQVGERVGFIDRRGELVVPLQFARARSFHDGRAMVQLPDAGRQPGMLGYIDKTGRFVFTDGEGRFTDLRDFHDNLAAAQADGRWGFIDKRHTFRIEPRFEAVSDFAGGVAAVKLDGKWGYIDKAGRVVVEPRYDVATDFEQGLGLVETVAGFGYVNRVGDERIELAWPWAEPFHERLGRVAREPNFAYVDVAGGVVWDPQSPLRAIRDVRLRETIRIEVRRHPRGHRLVEPPPWRPAIEEPYPPDHLYEPELPRPPVP